MATAKSKRDQIITELKKSYNMELETVINYLANSIHLDGVRAEEIKKSLAADIQEELTHAQRLAQRLKTLESGIPGSQALVWEQTGMQPPKDKTDIVSIIKGVIAAENGAIEQYLKIIKLAEGEDYVTQDLCIQLMADEEEHRRLFKGFLTEYARK